MFLFYSLLSAFVFVYELGDIMQICGVIGPECNIIFNMTDSYTATKIALKYTYYTYD